MGLLDPPALSRAQGALRTQVRREVLRAVPALVLHPAPPTVTLSAGNAATQVTNPVAVTFSDPALRYTACDGVESPFGQTWHVIGVTPVGSDVDRGAPYALDFTIDSADFEIGLQGFTNTRDYKLYVDGQPLTTDVQAGPGNTGLRHWLRLLFTDRRPRHIRCVTNAGIAGLSVGPTDTLWTSNRPVYGKRAYFLGDSFTQGAAATYQQETYLYGLCDRLGWEPLDGGEAGTGYLNTSIDSSHPERNSFPNRIGDIPTDTDVVVVYGGTNDLGFTGDVQAAATATYSAIAARLPGVPVYVFGCQYPTGAADTARDAIDTAIQAAAVAAPNVVAFTSVKSWVTGTGNAGSPTGSGNADVVTSSDGLHPTTTGHRMIGGRMYEAIMPTWAPPPTP